MTRKAVLALCHQSYRSMKSYHGTTEVESLYTWPEGTVFPAPPELSDPPTEVRDRSSAEIWYASPNLLRIEGHLSWFVWEAEGESFEMISDGSNAWSCWSVTDNEWEKEEESTTAIAGFSGVSGGACYTIPRLLVGEDLMWVCKCPDQEAEDVEEAGHLAWRVHIPTDVGEVTYWVDKASGLLIRMHAFTDNVRVLDRTAEILQRAADRGVTVNRFESPVEVETEGPLTTETTEVFTAISCNEDLPASLFARPDGAPG